MKYGPIPTGLLERVGLATGRVPVPLLDAIFTIMKSRILMAGVRLGVFEAMRDGPRTAADLASRLDLDADTLDLLLRTLVSADYIDQAGAGRYGLSALGRRTMVSGAPGDLTGLMEWNYTHWECMAHFEELLQSGRGVDFHRTMEDPARWQHYQKAMLELARLEAPLVARRVPVPNGASRLLDIGGAHGLLGAVICRRHPPMRAVVLDLAAALPHARALAEAEGIADIVDHREGRLLEDDFGTGFDVALMANILHHFKPDQIEAILARVRQALRPGGTVAIWDVEAPSRQARASIADGVALFFRLMSTAGAYNGGQYATWLTTADFQRAVVRRPRLWPGHVLVHAVKG